MFEGPGYGALKHVKMNLRPPPNAEPGTIVMFLPYGRYCGASSRTPAPTRDTSASTTKAATAVPTTAAPPPTLLGEFQSGLASPKI